MPRICLSATFVLVFFLSLLATTESGLAKELTNRLGIGYSDSMSINVPSITVRYYPDPDLGLSAALGVDTEKDNSKFGFLVKMTRVIFMEDHLNFFMGASAALVSKEIGSENHSGFELSGLAGVEFFFAGLDSLGLTFETGIGVTSLSSEVRFRTIGDSPFRGGLIFYF